MSQPTPPNPPYTWFEKRFVKRAAAPTEQRAKQFAKRAAAEQRAKILAKRAAAKQSAKHRAQNLFSKVFNENYEKVEIIPDNRADKKKKTLKCRDIWKTIQFSDEYKALSFTEKRRQGNMKQLYLWLGGMTPIAGNTKTGKLIVGYLPKE